MGSNGADVMHKEVEGVWALDVGTRSAAGYRGQGADYRTAAVHPVKAVQWLTLARLVVAVGASLHDHRGQSITPSHRICHW